VKRVSQLRKGLQKVDMLEVAKSKDRAIADSVPEQ